jgi:hypothetical protein
VNDTWRITGGGFGRGGAPANVGGNPPNGAVINYFAKNANDSTKASISIYDKNKKLIKTFSTSDKENKIEITKGANQFVWNLRYPEGEKADGMILWNGTPSTIVAPPGNYFATVKVDKDSAEVQFVINAEANYKTTQTEYEQQFAFLQKAQGKFNEVQKAIKDIKTLRSQINEFTAKQLKPLDKDIKKMADSINKQLTVIEETLYQTKAKSGQDVLNFPIKLNDKLSGVIDAASSGNMAPSKQVLEVYDVIAKDCDVQLGKLKSLQDVEIAAFNQLIREKALPVIGVGRKE